MIGNKGGDRDSPTGQGDHIAGFDSRFVQANPIEDAGIPPSAFRKRFELSHHLTNHQVLPIVTMHCVVGDKRGDGNAGQAD